MDSTSIVLIIVLAVLIILSAYFSATETAFSSFNKIKIKNLASGGNQRAALVLQLSDNYDRLLSTILIGNNIVNITSASLATVIFVGYFGEAGVTLSTVVMTILVLIFGEISPKSIARDAPERFAMLSAPILKIFLWALSPLNFIFMQWKKLLSIVFKVSDDKGITEEELLIMVEEAQHDGGINAQEGELIRSAIEFNDLDVLDVLKPRVDVVAVSADATKDEIAQLFLESGYSRLPVFKDSIDNIMGVIHQKDFHNYIAKSDRDFLSILKQVLFIPQTMKISKLMKLLQQTKSHIAVVVDEYGGTIGIVTLEDIIEELVGEIWDEHDEVVSHFEKLPSGDYKVNCNASLDKLFELLHVDKEAEFTAIGGWILREFGRIPKEGDQFEFQNWVVTVLKTSQRRIVEVLISIKDKTEDAKVAS